MSRICWKHEHFAGHVCDHFCAPLCGTCSVAAARIGETYAAAVAEAAARGPVPAAVTQRILDLLAEARGTLRQIQYEGSHTVRQDPEPTYGSPWQTPDLPADVLADLAAVTIMLDNLHRKAHLLHECPLPTLEV